MLRAFLLCWLIMTVAGLGGCHTPYADLTATQDPKYVVGKGSKFAFPEQTTPSLSARLATETTQQQMRAMGYTVTSSGGADYFVRANSLAKDLTVVDDAGGPAIGTGVGGGSGGVFTGVGVSFPIGSPQAEVLKRTQLDITVETVQPPQVVVWQGKILADTADEQKYRAQFYRALLMHLGETYNATVRLDKVDAPE